jgi:hypothetical protein
LHRWALREEIANSVDYLNVDFVELFESFAILWWLVRNVILKRKKENKH